MKIFVLFLLLSTTLFSQTYMNVLFSDASSKNADVDDVTEITFNGDGTEMTTTLSSGSSMDLVSSITEITFDGAAHGGSLPVELTSFYVTENDGEVILNWTTATEVNNYGFDVESKRASTGSATASADDWTKIDFVEGHGNSNSPQNYSFVASTGSATSISFRLKQIDTDGAFEYSDVVTVEMELSKEFKLEQNYPNPFNPSTQITYALPRAGEVTLKVYSILGEQLVTLVSEYKEAGTYQVKFNASGNMATGVYITRMESDNYSKIIKMLLVK